MAHKRRSKAPERIEGQPFVSVPLSVLNSEALMGAGHTARSLLWDVARQLNGYNNGHLQLAMSWLSKRGWNSEDVVNRAKNELIARGLLVKTRQGGLNNGPSLYAVTWLRISNFNGLDIDPRQYHPGAYAGLNKLEIPKKNRASPPAAGAACSASRRAPAPCDGAATLSTALADGARATVLEPATAPPDGDNASSAICTTASGAVAVGGLAGYEVRSQPHA